MPLADSNVWLALALAGHQFHAAAQRWLAHRKNAKKVMFCRATQQSLLRLLTTRALMTGYGLRPLSNKAAWMAYEGFMADERVSWVTEPHGLDSHWKKLTARAQPSPKLWMDAYLAAFAMAGRFQLVTTDNGFRQFQGLDLLVLSRT